MITESSATAELVGGLEALATLAPERAVRKAVPFLTRLTDGAAYLAEHVVPLFREAKDADEWYVARRWEGEGDSCSLEIFVWPAGSGTLIHDHTSWGVFRCVVGTTLEKRYERLDDGSRFEHARLKKAWQHAWGPEDGISTVLPGNGGIHRVENPGVIPAISVHLYGPRLGEMDGRDYDPSREYVCDRRPA
ncbi:MAG TPA: cysteine dioxygenase family protein [Rubrobacter sp.]|nr:cysteine dioxygenase family protein [Rubrobacter sp.]